MLFTSSIQKLPTMVVAVVGINLASVLFGVSYADLRTQAIVTVYSEGKVMATYEAIDRGRMDKDCYVFHVKKGVRELEVRVCGTFTVEQVR